MRKGEKFLKDVGILLYMKRAYFYVAPENIYDYIQNKMTDEEFDKLTKN